jgi:protease-4
MTMQEFVDEQLKAAQTDNDVKAVILKVDSPGGEVLASDEINASLRRFQESSHKPVVVSMGTLAASGGYYISAPARWIVANELTITGSIGVIMHGYNYRKLMDKVGLRPHVYKSGKFKDMLSGEREPDDTSPEAQKISDEEDAMVQALINETYNKFKSVVQAGRDAASKLNGGDGRPLAANWTDYADGRILSGRGALDLGFVDELGDFQTAVKRAEKLTSISGANLVEYRVPVDLTSMLSHLFGKSDAPALKVDLGFDLPRLKAGLPYYILPTTIPN